MPDLFPREGVGSGDETSTPFLVIADSACHVTAHNFLSACLPKERNFTVAASANAASAYNIIALNKAQYCTVINYAGVRQWRSRMTKSHACNLIGSPGS